MIRKHHRLTALALALIAVAILAPSAWARPIDDPALPAAIGSSQPSPTHQRQQVDTPSTLPHGVAYSSYDVGRRSTPLSDVPVAPVASNPGFDWGDAGIGAGAAFALTMIGLGGVLVLNSRRHREERPATTA